MGFVATSRPCCITTRCLRNSTKDGLPQRDVYAIHESSEGDLWIGTYGGLARFSDGRFTSYTEKDGLSSDRVRAIYQDGDGTLCIGTYDGGLNRFKDGRARAATTITVTTDDDGAGSLRQTETR